MEKLFVLVFAGIAFCVMFSFIAAYSIEEVRTANNQFERIVAKSGKVFGFTGIVGTIIYFAYQIAMIV